MPQSLHILRLFALLVFSTGALAEVIRDDFWITPRSGETVVADPSIRAVLGRWVEEPDRQLVIRYPGGEEGLIWANDLRDWLVACGVSSSSITLLTGSGGSSVSLDLE